MNIETRTETVNEASKLITDRLKSELQSIYMKAYHEGRHDYRDSVKSFLIIDPAYRELLKEESNDPCIKCPRYTTHNAMGCVGDYSTKCLLKKRQFVALDVLQHFK